MFPAFICANYIVSLVNSLFGVKSFIPFSSLSYSSSPSSGDMSDKSTDSSLSGNSSLSVDSSLFSDCTL